MEIKYDMYNVQDYSAASDKAYLFLAHRRWSSPDTPASSITQTGRHDIAEILLKVELNTKIQSRLQCLRMLLVETLA